MRFLGHGWSDDLGFLVRAARSELLLCAPFITEAGAVFIAENLAAAGHELRTITVTTNLSPSNVCSGATDPRAVRALLTLADETILFHVPRLHAKVYAANSATIIVSSANLTRGGLFANCEYGVMLDDRNVASSVCNDVCEYARLGSNLTIQALDDYCAATDEVRSLYKEQTRSATRAAQAAFRDALVGADNHLIRARLRGGPLHRVFSSTVEYLLGRHGPMDTQSIHQRVEEIHPDLCDNSIERVIDGVRFGKKWKHAVRTSQQYLKRNGRIELHGSKWHLTRKEVDEDC